jgi:hypothetical protein
MSISDDRYDKGTACTVDATARRPRTSSVDCLNVIPPGDGPGRSCHRRMSRAGRGSTRPCVGGHGSPW